MGARSSLVSESCSRDIPVLRIKKKKNMTKSRFCRFPYLTLVGRSSDAGILCG